MDRRYKLNQQMVNQMRALRKSKYPKYSYYKIGKMFGVSTATALYWCDEKQRNFQRTKNAKRKRTGEEEKKRYIRYETKRRQERFMANPKTRLLHNIQAMLDEKRTHRLSVYGIPKDYCIKLKETGVLRTPNAKII